MVVISRESQFVFELTLAVGYLEKAKALRLTYEYAGT